MARKSVTETYGSSHSTSEEHSKSQSQSNSQSKSTNQSQSQSQSQSQQHSVSKNVLDKELLNSILGGLSKQMTDEEIMQFAESLLKPQLNAGLEAAQQKFDTAKLSKEQEIENLATQLAGAIDKQNAAYKQNMADVETAALARGMGRSSYTLQNLSNQGKRLAEAVKGLTDENTRVSDQIRKQITQAADQNAQTQGRLNTDYASQLAAKVQEMREEQRRRWDSNYLTAISGAMGKETWGNQSTTGTQNTQGSQETVGSQTTQGSTDSYGTQDTNSSSTSVTTSYGGGGSRKGSGVRVSGMGNGPTTTSKR